MWNHCFGSSSAARYAIKSRAVSRVCRRDETKMRVGLVGECVLMAVKWSRVSGQWSGVSGHLEKRAYSLSPFVDNSVCPRTRGCEFPWERAGLRAGSRKVPSSDKNEVSEVERGPDMWTCLVDSQSARSRAFAKAVDSPTIRTGRLVWADMKLRRDTITSNTGPRSCPTT